MVAGRDYIALLKMNHSFLTSRLLTTAIGASILAFSPSTHWADEARATSPVITEGVSSSFRAVSSRLELGGCFFEYSETGGMAFVGEVLDALMKIDAKASPLPPDFSVKKAITALGLDSIVATGSSSRERTDGTFHSRSNQRCCDSRIQEPENRTIHPVDLQKLAHRSIARWCALACIAGAIAQWDAGGFFQRRFRADHSGGRVSKTLIAQGPKVGGSLRRKYFTKYQNSSCK